MYGVVPNPCVSIRIRTLHWGVLKFSILHEMNHEVPIYQLVLAHTIRQKSSKVRSYIDSQQAVKFVSIDHLHIIICTYLKLYINMNVVSVNDY